MLSLSLEEVGKRSVVKSSALKSVTMSSQLEHRARGAPTVERFTPGATLLYTPRVPLSPGFVGPHRTRCSPAN